MRPRDFLSPEDIQLAENWIQTVNEMASPIREMEEAGMPVREHAAKQKEFEQWRDTIQKVFDLKT